MQIEIDLTENVGFEACERVFEINMKKNIGLILWRRCNATSLQEMAIEINLRENMGNKTLQRGNMQTLMHINAGPSG